MIPGPRFETAGGPGTRNAKWFDAIPPLETFWRMPLPRTSKFLRWLLVSMLFNLGTPAQSVSTNAPRGYYMTFMRMPVMELADWKDTLDCVSEDRANTVILWMGGAFQSKKFPITWTYNKEHKNIEHDFVRELIDYAHQKRIRILLGFTPFGYDGVNQFPLEHPELKAQNSDGQPVDSFGIQSWGWSLCPSKADSQRFMMEYIREMIFDFYPNADGLMIESSDYNICRCSDCGVNYYDREFDFVKKISEELWERKAEATILVYPHYFTGRKVNAGTAIESEAAKKPFDKRWQLVFTPHSARIESEMLKSGVRGIYSDQGLSLGTPGSLREGARISWENALGYIPSFEPFSYVLAREEFGASHLVGKRLYPLGFDWMEDPRRPLRELPARLLRFAFRELSERPDLPSEELRRRIGEYFFGVDANATRVSDLLFLQECINQDRTWVASSPLVNPEAFKIRSAREKWGVERNKHYEQSVRRLREIAARYNNATQEAEREICRIASFIVGRWNQAFSDNIQQNK